MDTNTSLLILIADLNSQIHALQEDNAALRKQLGAGDSQDSYNGIPHATPAND